MAKKLASKGKKEAKLKKDKRDKGLKSAGRVRDGVLPKSRSAASVKKESKSTGRVRDGVISKSRPGNVELSLEELALRAWRKTYDNRHRRLA